MKLSTYGAPSDTDTVLKTLQQLVTCFLQQMNLCSSVSSKMYYILQQLLPAEINFSYNLRPRYHNRQLTRKSAHVNDSCFITRILHSNSLTVISSLFPQKRGNMILPALVCLCMCLPVTTITKKVVDISVTNFMGRFLGGKGRPSSCFVTIGRGIWK